MTNGDTQAYTLISYTASKMVMPPRKTYEGFIMDNHNRQVTPSVFKTKKRGIFSIFLDLEENHLEKEIAQI